MKKNLIKLRLEENNIISVFIKLSWLSKMRVYKENKYVNF